MRYFCLILGPWKVEAWHLYRYGWSHSVKKPSNQWRVWRRII